MIVSRSSRGSVTICEPVNVSRLDDMLNARKFPRTDTDDQWWRGNVPIHKEHGEAHANRVRQLVERNGGKIGPNDDYISYMADYPGDPEAVIHGHDARAQIRRKLEKRAQRLAEKARQPRVLLSESLIAEETDKIPDFNRLPKKERKRIREDVIQKHAYVP